MKKTMIRNAVATSAILASAVSGAAYAQTIDNNFSRDRSVAVNERAKTEFTPLGIRAGAFMIQPQVGVGLGYNDNILYTDTNKESDSFLSLSPAVTATSNWSRHMLAFGAEVTSVGYSNNSSENATDWNLNANGRYDISSRINIFGQLAHAENRESRTEPYSPLNAAEPVKVTSDAGNIGLTVVGNRLRFIGTVGSVDTSYDDVLDLNGDPIIESTRDLTTKTVSGRVDYALSPDVSVFVLAAGNDRAYKRTTTTNLDSSGLILSIGTSFDLDKLARGEIQIGSLEQTYDNAALGKQTSFYYNGKVEYFPTQLTTLTATVNRAYSEAVGFGANSALTSTGGLAVDHELLRNLILSGSLSYTAYEFKGIDRDDKRTSVYLGGRYYMNPRMSVNVGYRYDKLDSSGTQAYRTYTDNSLLAAVVFKY